MEPRIDEYERMHNMCKTFASAMRAQAHVLPHDFMQLPDEVEESAGVMMAISYLVRDEAEKLGMTVDQYLGEIRGGLTCTLS